MYCTVWTGRQWHEALFGGHERLSTWRWWRSSRGPEFLIIWAIILLFSLPFLAVQIWALIDAAGKPDWAWERAGANKVLYSC